MSDYWHADYKCPFFEAAGKRSIRCEGGSVVAFRTREGVREYIGRHCATMKYEGCSIAAQLIAEAEGRK